MLENHMPVSELSEVLPIGMVRFDERGKALSLNAAAHELLGAMGIGPDNLARRLRRGHTSLAYRTLREKSVESRWVSRGRTLHLICRAAQKGMGLYLFMIDLTAQEETKAKRIQSEKMASLDLLIAGLAHEINTPLGAIHSNNDTIARSIARIAQLLDKEERLDPAERRRAEGRLIEVIRELCQNTLLATERLTSIVGSLKNFACLDEGGFKKTDIHHGIDSTLTIVRHHLKDRIQVEKRYGNIPLVECHPNRLGQVFMNLFVNASQAMPEDGAITIETFRKGSFVGIAISDTGIGIPKENLAKVFDPGFTTKGVGIGTGLGLSICYQIIEEHGGRIEVSSSDRGTTFTIMLPIAHKRR